MEQKKRSASRSDTSEIDVDEPVTVDTSEVDDLLDAIDDVLEENAEEFVKGYIQKGGE